jgi:dihydroorotate dehydrogenase
MAGEPGGLSGAPLGDIAAWVLERIANRVGGRVPLVAVGGIMSGEDARRRRDAGATLIQIYTGLVYGGPGLVREIAAAVRG